MFMIHLAPLSECQHIMFDLSPLLLVILCRFFFDSLMQLCSSELEQDESILCQSPDDNLSSGCMGMFLPDKNFCILN